MVLEFQSKADTALLDYPNAAAIARTVHVGVVRDIKHSDLITTEEQQREKTQACYYSKVVSYGFSGRIT